MLLRGRCGQMAIRGEFLTAETPGFLVEPDWRTWDDAGGWIEETRDNESQEAPLVRTTHLRFTIRRMAVAVAAMALVLWCLRWLLYPHIKVMVFNDSFAAILDVRLRFLYGERTAERIEPGGYAATEIQSGGESGVFISYRDQSGGLRTDEPLYYSESTASPDRGYLEVHISSERIGIVKSIYNFDLDPVSPVIQVRPTAQMTVR